jgi:putative glycosyltransferase (TIGR04372 family)
LIRGYQHSLFAFQLILDERKNKLLSISEIANLRGILGRVSEMKDSGLTFVENSPSELVTYVAEMLSFTNSELKHTEQDRYLLSRYNEALVKSGYPPMLKNHSRPCISFLRKNQDLLL